MDSKEPKLDVFQSAPAITGGRSTSRKHQARFHQWFQSAPAITGGRSIVLACVAAVVNVFQSAPAITGGRSGKQPLHDRGDSVSIRARHHWRAIPSMPNEPFVCIFVSIRARHHWRAIPPRRRAPRCAPRCFNPRPPSLAGDPWPVHSGPACL